MHPFVRFRSLLATAGIAAILAGCAQSGATPAATQLAAGSPAAGSPQAATVALTTNATLGMILTGDGGKTLYVFGKDSNGTSACSGSCASTWPPFTVGAGQSAVAGSGVTGTISTIQRSDGTSQVAINGHPLYYFGGDKAAGDTNGEGLNGVWYAAGADGSPVQAAGGGYNY